MFKFLSILITILPLSTMAAVNCTISDFEVEVYDHGGTYIHGKLNGANVVWIDISGNTTGSHNASNRRLSLALSAQMAGKELNAYFSQMNNCSEYTNYTKVNGLRLKK
jgi:hypothetical protein